MKVNLTIAVKQADWWGHYIIAINMLAIVLLAE